MKYGELLKQVAKSVREETELDALKTHLMDVAKSGYDSTTIDKLEQQYPIIYKSGKLWSWLRENDIGHSGSANGEGNNASYLFWWK